MPTKRQLSKFFDKKIQNSLLVLFLLFSLYLFFSAINDADSFAIFKESVQENILSGALAFVFMEALSIVIAPVTTVFLIPVASEIFGPFVTAILSAVGWTLGSAIAFMIARRFGRPVLEKIIDPLKLEKYRKYVSADAEFLTVIILRIVLPVDLLSYFIGLLTVMSFKKYIMATIIGITPFSFIYSYGGDALIKGNYWEIFIIATLSVIFFIFMFAVFGGSKKRKKR